MNEISSITNLLIKLLERKEQRREAMFREEIKPLFDAMRRVTELYRELLGQIRDAPQSAEGMAAAVARMRRIRDKYITDREMIVERCSSSAVRKIVDPDVRKFVAACFAQFYEPDLPFIPSTTIGNMLIEIMDGVSGANHSNDVCKNVYVEYERYIGAGWKNVVRIYTKVSKSFASKTRSA